MVYTVLEHNRLVVLYYFIPGNYSDEKKAASQADSKASVNIATVKQKKRALNRMYYIPCTQTKDVSAKQEKYATNSDDKKVVSRAYSKASYSINPEKNSYTFRHESKLYTGIQSLYL